MNAMSSSFERLSQRRGPSPTLGDRKGWAQALSIVCFSAIFFLFSRSIVWGQQVSLEDFDILLVGAIPFVFFLVADRVLSTSLGVEVPVGAPRILGWAWVISLLSFVVLHVLRLFDEFERPIRAAFEPGFLRYTSYAVVYTLIGYVLASVGAWCFSKQTPSRSWGMVLAGGFLANVLYFCVALFMIRI